VLLASPAGGSDATSQIANTLNLSISQLPAPASQTGLLFHRRTQAGASALAGAPLNGYEVGLDLELSGLSSLANGTGERVKRSQAGELLGPLPRLTYLASSKTAAADLW
jgi:hypothetical protein